MSAPPIQLSRTGASVTTSAEVLEALAADFMERKAALLPGLIEPGLLGMLQTRLRHARFEEKVHGGIGPNKEWCLADRAILALLHFIVNAEPFFTAVRAIAHCPPIAVFLGRVYRVLPGQGHRDAWHDDAHPARLLALTVNLSEAPFSGAILQIRDRRSSRLVTEFANTGAGDGILFALSERLEHRITDIDPGAPKTAFAGWFGSEVGFASIVKRALGHD